MTNLLKKVFSTFLFLIILLQFFHLEIAYAVTITLNQYPSSISADPFSVDLYIFGASAGQNYVRADLYKEGSTNYFGDTNNGLDWYNGSDGKLYFPVTIDSSKSGSAIIQARIGSPSSSEFSGAGLYKLRIRRYTSSGNPASGDQQTPVDVQINFSLPSPTPMPAPISTVVPASTKITPTKSLSKTPPTSTPAQKISSPAPSAGHILSTEISHRINIPTSVLGQSTKSAAATVISHNVDPGKEVKILGSNKNNIFRIIAITGIAAFVFSCAILLFQRFKNKKNNNE